MPQLDLVIHGGHLSPGSPPHVVDIGVLDGRIVQLGGEMQAMMELDARSKLLLPGGGDERCMCESTPPGRSGWRRSLG